MKYLFSTDNTNLIITLDTESGKYNPEITTINDPNITLENNRIWFYENGKYIRNFSFDHVGTISGVTPTSIADAFAKLNVVIDGLYLLVSPNFKGSIVPTDTPIGIEDAVWIATQAGTYTNFGGVVVSVNSRAEISRVGGVFSISQTPLDLTTYLKIVDGNKINPFVNQAYPINSQVNSLGKDWYNTSATAIGEIPGTSVKWVERLMGYSTDSIYGNPFTILNKTITFSNGLLGDNSGYVSTNFLELSLYQDLKIYGFSGNAVALIAFYDINKNFISAINGTEKSRVWYSINNSNIPSTAKYIRCTGLKDAYNFVNVASIKKLEDKNTDRYLNNRGLLISDSINIYYRASYITYLGNIFKSGDSVVFKATYKGLNYTQFQIYGVRADTSIFLLTTYVSSSLSMDFKVSESFVDYYLYFAGTGLGIGELYIQYDIVPLYVNNANISFPVVKKYSDVFSLDDGYVSSVNGMFSENTTTKCTDYIKIVDRNNNIYIKGLSGSNAALLVFYDVDKKYISAINGTEKNNIDYTILSSTIPANAIYVRASGNVGFDNYLIIGSVGELGNYLRDIENKIDNRSLLKGKYIFGNNINWTKNVPLQSVSTMQFTTSEIYTRYDNLVSVYPNYVTKIDGNAFMTGLGISRPTELIGLNSYIYKFKPVFAKVGDNNAYAPIFNTLKVFIVSGTHNEYSSINTLANTMKWICENWKTDENAEELKYNVEFYILPTLNVWGVENDSRTNYNGIDINRNFPTTRWIESGISTNMYSGIIPGSEYETKLLMNYVSSINPQVFIDFHNFGSNVLGNMMYGSSISQLGLDILASSFSLASRNMSKIDSNLPEDTMFGFIEKFRTEGSEGLYFDEKKILSFTYEVTNSAYYSNKILQATIQKDMTDAQFNTNMMQAFVAFLLTTLKSYSDVINGREKTMSISKF